jgi:hypothetical protein
MARTTFEFTKRDLSDTPLTIHLGRYHLSECVVSIDAEVVMIARLLRSVLSAVILAGLGTLALPVHVGACPSSHGEYTSSLCNSDSMVGNGAYLISPNGNLRLNMQGNIVTYDTTTNPYGVLYVFYSAFNGNANRMIAGAYQAPPGAAGFQLYDSSDNYLGIGGWQGGTDYVKLHDDGCLWYHYSDDSYDSGVCSVG